MVSPATLNFNIIGTVFANFLFEHALSSSLLIFSVYTTKKHFLISFFTNVLFQSSEGILEVLL